MPSIVTPRNQILPLNFIPFHLFLVCIFFIGYLAFVPIGPYPIHIYGMKLDTLFSIGLFILLVPIALYVPHVYPAGLIVSLTAYLFITFVSVATSNDIDLSLREWGVMLGYVVVCFSAPLIILPKVRLLRSVFLVIGLIVSSVIIYLYLFTEFGSVARFALGTDPFARRYDWDVWVDPNMTATGLAMAILSYVPNFTHSRHSFLKLSMVIGTIIAILAAVVITISRSTMLALILSYIIAMVTLNFRGLIESGLRYARYSLIAVLLPPVLLASVYLVIPSLFVTLYERLVESIYDSVRIMLLEDVFSVYLSGIKTVLIGNGFQTLNPHNEYVRNLACSGIVGFLGFICLLGSIYFLIVRKIQSYYWNAFSAIALYYFILIAIIFYGHVRTMWTPFLFILTLYLEERQSQMRIVTQAHESVPDH